MSDVLAEQQPLLNSEDIEAVPVYPIIHMIRADVMHFIDTPLTYDALTAPDLTYTLIRPLHEKYSDIQRRGNMSVVFCLLLNRVHFLRDQNVSTAPTSKTRAVLCEILALRVLRDYGDNVLELTMAITTSWVVYSGADSKLIEQAREERDSLEDRVGNAIEMAIIGKAKRFIKCSSCQKVIDNIWVGKCVYQADSTHSILSDTYKRNPVHFYDPHKAPLLDHYRLKVPAVRSVLEYMNFCVLFILFVITLETIQRDRINVFEGIFMVYALGFTLDKLAAMQEHGLKVFFKGTWNGFDMAFITAFLGFAILRLYGVHHHHKAARDTGTDLLALIACLMFPRLAFVTLKNNLMVLSLRAMLTQFIILMLIAVFCFGGFLYGLWTLSKDGERYSLGTIAWWMLDLWFGLDASGFQQATTFHPVFGPILMVTYACLSNTLLLTVLVSILSNTFSTINEDAEAEAMFRRAVSTIEGVKADSLFSYQPPVNLVALLIMLPASYILSARWFHKVNVFLIRVTNFPILLGIAWYERQSKKSGSSGFYDTFSTAMETVFESLPRNMRRLTFFEGLVGTDADIDAIFELESTMDSALDTEEYSSSTVSPLEHQQIPQRRRSSASRDRKSPRPSPALHQPSQQAEGHDQLGTSPAAMARRRLDSALQRGAEAASSFTSPLAQIFQPLIVDDDPPQDSQLLAPPSGPISYGPASRRRLMSMPAPYRRSPADSHHASSVALRKFPTTSSGSHQVIDEPLSESPDFQEEIPKPTSEIEQEKEIGSPGLLTERLNKLEAGQRRIEALLLQALQKMTSP